MSKAIFGVPKGIRVFFYSSRALKVDADRDDGRTNQKKKNQNLLFQISYHIDDEDGPAEDWTGGSSGGSGGGYHTISIDAAVGRLFVRVFECCEWLWQQWWLCSTAAGAGAASAETKIFLPQIVSNEFTPSSPKDLLVQQSRLRQRQK